MTGPASPYALCWLAWPPFLRVVVRARIAPLLLADAIELAKQQRERWPERAYWLEAWVAPPLRSPEAR